MSLLDAMKNKNAGATAPVNPFMKKTPGAATTPAVNPFMKKNIQPKIEVVEPKKEVTPEAKVEEKPKTEVKADVKKVAEEAKKVAETKVETKKEEDKKIEEAVKEMDSKEVEELVEGKVPEEIKVDAKTDEEPKDEKKTRTRKNTSKAKEEIKVETKPVDIPEEEVEYINDFTEAAQAVRTFAEDPVWNKFTEDVKAQLESIVITYDMDTVKIKKANADLNSLRDSIGFEFVKTKSEYENLASKEPKGLIERIEKTGYTDDDKNDRDRTKAGIEACHKFKDKNTGKCIDLFVLKDQYKIRYDFLKYIMDTLNFKQQCLVTINSAVKQEGELSKYTSK